ncbi:MAG: hypothetical protein ACFFDY_01135 [Candidatus Thorarchaeota archaeon]
MTTIELPEIMANDIVEKIYNTTGPRSKDLHLTAIINDIEKILYPKEYERKKGFSNPWFAVIGFIWEECLTLAFKSLLGFRPKAIHKDGIACSPDGIKPEQEIVDEYKCTWRSTKTKPWNVWKWMVQIKAYCYVSGYNIARFHVLYIMGDYKFTGPKCIPFLLEFTDEELQNNWDMLLEHARTMIND